MPRLRDPIVMATGPAEEHDGDAASSSFPDTVSRCPGPQAATRPSSQDIVLIDGRDGAAVPPVSF